ncbi:MAG TPA: UDP-3-O-(3-hydroxymyristoyl)glucosamine N-acyltransferase, partial [Ilumatobacteraceae bacterium]
LAFARVLAWLHPRPAVSGIHPTAVVHPAARVGRNVGIGPYCVVGADCAIGDDTVLHAHVTLYDGVVIGRRCLLHAGVVIGADGFGFVPTKDRVEKIPQIGGVEIGDDVEVGANTTIDRGTMGDTVIEDGVKLDNLIQVAHNVRIGAHTAIAAKAGIAGSTHIGRHCTIGGAAGIVGHIRIADHVQIDAATIVTRSITKPGRYSGVFPFDDNASWEKNAATLRQLYALRERLRALEKKT